MRILAIETSCDDPRSKKLKRMLLIFTTGRELPYLK